MNSMEIYPFYEDMCRRKMRNHRSNGCLRRNQPDSPALKMEDVATSQNMMVASGIRNEEIFSPKACQGISSADSLLSNSDEKCVECSH